MESPSLPHIHLFITQGLTTVLSGYFSGPPILISPESAAGIKAGAKTGVSTLVCGILFGIATFFYPIFAAVPAAGTAPLLIMVGVMLFANVKVRDCCFLLFTIYCFPLESPQAFCSFVPAFLYIYIPLPWFLEGGLDRHKASSTCLLCALLHSFHIQVSEEGRVAAVFAVSILNVTLPLVKFCDVFKFSKRAATQMFEVVKLAGSLKLTIVNQLHFQYLTRCSFRIRAVHHDRSVHWRYDRELSGILHLLHYMASFKEKHSFRWENG